MIRCCNLDWLSVSCLEPTTVEPLTADYYKSKGWDVDVRAYGTRVFGQMFTLKRNGVEVYEIRRDPLSKKDQGGIFDSRLCHIRFSNRTCYEVGCIDSLRVFLLSNRFQNIKINRIDICLDINVFDNQMQPQNLIDRYMKSEISKLNQSNIHAHGSDEWKSRKWNSLKWGSPTSKVTTKLYNKTMELGANPHNKEYIRQRWEESGLDTKKDVWRIEFSVSASGTLLKDTKREKHVALSLSEVDDTEKLIYIFLSLADHYFHFKYVEYKEDGELKRKDRCKDVPLFKTGGTQFSAVAGKLKTTGDPSKLTLRLIRECIDIYHNENCYDGKERCTAKDMANVLIHRLGIQKRIWKELRYKEEEVNAIKYGEEIIMY